MEEVTPKGRRRLHGAVKTEEKSKRDEEAFRRKIEKSMGGKGDIVRE